MNTPDLLSKPTPSVTQLARKYGVSAHLVDQRLRQGRAVELEHTDNLQVAEEIALDHLGEDLNYYQKLSNMETPSVKEHSTRTTAQGAPGTLSAKITRLYGGGVTCAKVRKLKSRKSATAHDKSQANWFINMHNCESQISEVMDTHPSTPITWTRTEDAWVTEFPFDDHTVGIEIADLEGDPPSLWVEFSVDGRQSITGKLRSRSAQLLGWVINAVHAFLQSHTHWSSVVFSGDPDEPSRNRLYAALIARMAKKIPGVRAEQTGYRFKLIKTQPLTEVFDIPAAHTQWRQYGDFWETNFEFDNHNVVVEMVADTGGISAHHVFDNRDIHMPDHSVGYEVIFRVNKRTDITGDMGTQAVKLLARVISVIQGFLQSHPWDYVYFTADSHSRIRLYSAMASMLAQKHYAQSAQWGGDFVIYKTAPITEVFDYKLSRDHWSVREQGSSYVTVDFDVDGQPYEMDIMSVREHPGIYDVVFGHRDSDQPIGITGTGSASRVFAAVAQLIEWAITRMNIQGIYFTAAEPSRQKLYAALSRRFARKLGWQLITDPSKFPYPPGAREQGYFVHTPVMDEAAGVNEIHSLIYKPSLLQEVFDYKLSRDDWKVKQRPNGINIDFKVDHDPYLLEITEFKKTPGIFKVIFSHTGVSMFDDSTGILNTGNAFQVFAAVAQLIEYSIKLLGIKAVYFTAAEPSRVKLYRSLTKYFAAKLNWKVTQDPQWMPVSSTDAQFMVYKPGFSITEQGGVGLVVPGVNMPAGQHPDEIRRQARKFGFDVTAQGVPPTARTDGKY